MKGRAGMQVATPWKLLKETGQAILQELRHASLRNERTVLCIQTASAVLLAIAFASALHLTERWWVALSAYAVYRASLRTIIRRCVERLAGTIVGGGAGLLLANMLTPHSAFVAPVFGIVAAVGIYAMIGSDYSYSWILGTVTALMVLEGIGNTPSLGALALARIVDVAVGVSTTALVAFVVAITAKRFFYRAPGETCDVAQVALRGGARPALRVQRGLHALQGACCIALIAWIDMHHPWPGLSQAVISIVAVLLVPASALSNGNAAQTIQRRLLNRLLGCLLATLCALLVLPVIGDWTVLCWMALAIAIGLAAYVQAGDARVSYLGTQFGVGFIIAFVQDGNAPPNAAGAAERLAGILVALALMGVLAILVSLASRTRRPAA